MTEPRLVNRMRLGVVALLACVLFPSFAYGWHDPAWAYRQEITILPALADSSLSGFPYLVKITDGANPVFANALANGDDIVFTSSDGSTQLAHELEKYDSNTNELYAWVRVPTISSAADTVIYMYYGNGSVTASEEDVEGTWDSDFVDVQHLQETAGTHFDSTSNNNDATPLNGVIQNATGQIDGANQFDGSNDKVDTADSASLRVVEMTVEAWVYVPSSIPAGFDGIVVHAPSTSNWYGLWKNSNRFHFRWSTGSVRRTDFNATFSPNQWYYVAGVLDVGADQVRTYQNDNLDTTINGPSAPSPTAGPLYIGHTFSGSEFFPGFIDEVRISRIARSDAWIKASARNQGTPDTYQNLGSEEPRPVAGTSLLLVVGNAASPSARDLGKKSQIESWGYVVTLIDDGDSQANFNAAAAANDVVYVTASIGGGTLADKLTNSSVGIVNEFSGKLDNFGFSSTTNMTLTFDQFTETDAAHYISEPFGGGGVTQFTSNITMPVPSGTLAPGLQVPGSLGGRPALVTLDSGAQRWDGTPSPDRRVHLPFGAADISQLTADGLTLMLRSIEWASGVGGGGAAEADLALTKSDSPDPVSVGSTITYGLTATNNGPDGATNVTLVDTLPADVDWQLATPSQGSCVHSGEPLGGTVTCTLGTIANGANATVDIEVVAPGTTGVISNSATVSADQADPNASDNTAVEDTTITAPPGSSVCQVDPSGTYIEAENFTGTIVQGTATFSVESSTPGFNGSGYLRSNGGSTSSPPVHEGKIYNIDFTTSGTYNVWMRGYGLNSSSDSAFIGLNGTSVGALNEGGTYNTWVWSNGIQTGSNQITVPAAGYRDFNTWIREPNHRIDGFYITQGGETPTGGIPLGAPTLDPTQCTGANLALTKTDSADPVSVGNAFTYSLTATNNGGLNATNVTLVDTLPADVDWQSATPSQGLCVHSGEPLGGTVTCTLGTIANGANTTVDIDVVAPGTTGVISNSATISAAESDPDASDNTATEDTTIVDPSANLSVTIAEDHDPAGINLPYVYTVTVTNPGPANATLVTLVDTLPGTVTYQSAVPSQGVCAEASGVVTCDLGDLNNGSIATIDITVTAPATLQTVTNTAVVSAAEPDPDLSDNTWEEDTDIVDPPPADLELTKIDVPDPVIGGNPLTYTVTINNLGLGTATLVQLTDTLPASVIFISATPSQGSCSEAGGTVDCALGTILNAAGATVTIVVTAPATAGTITNNASVSAVQSDPNTANNSVSADTAVTIIGDADLLMSKSDSPDPVLVNQALSYSLGVDNLGPDDATDVVLVDTLPATVTFQSAISSQGICSEAGGTVTCNLGTIANAANATVDIIVTAPPSAGSITNNAVVSTSASDSDTANDTASETTTVQNVNVNQLCYLVADAGGSGGGNDLLTRIDTADFDPLTNETNIGIGTGTNSIEAIAWNSATGILYAANGGRLGILSTTTGVFAPSSQAFGIGGGALGSISFNDVDGLTYDVTTGVLYGVERQSGTDVLLQINMATGAHVQNAFGAGIDYVPLPQIGGNHITDDIAVDPTTGVMYAAVNGGGVTDRLIRVNKATGATTDVALITVPDIEGLGTDATGQLWGTSGTQRILYELDKATGIGSNGRPINNGSDYEAVDCYALSPSVIADLAVTKIVDDAAPAEGTNATYTVTATNTGPGIATVVQLGDVLPAGVTFASAFVSQGTYNSITGEWFVGTLNAGSNATLNLQASVDIGSSGSTITNTASVTFLSQYDPNAGNDVASADIDPVVLPANLLVLKSVSTVRDPLGATAPAALAIPGAVVQYEVSVSNSGGGAATEAIITDTLSSNLTFLSGDFDGGAADIEIIVGAAAPVYCIAEVGGDTNTDGCFLSAGGDDLTVTIPVSGTYPTGLTVGTTAPDNVVVVHFRATVN